MAVRKMAKPAATARKEAVEPAPLRLSGFRVRQRREELAWKQSDLSHRLGVHASYVSEIERDRIDVAGSKVAAIARILAVSSDWLLNLSDDPRPHGRK